MLALDRFQALLFDSLTGFILGDAVGPENFIINVGPGKVSICLEHVRVETSPHHQLDHALGYSLFDQMSNPRVPEDVRSDMLCNTGPPGDPLQLQVYRGMGECFLMVVNKNRHFSCYQPEWVVVLPGGKIFPGHHEPNVAGYIGLEIHVRAWILCELMNRTFSSRYYERSKDIEFPRTSFIRKTTFHSR